MYITFRINSPYYQVDHFLGGGPESSAMALPKSQQNSISEKIEGFRETLYEAGLVHPTTFVRDGKFHRFSTNGKPSNYAGWYVLNVFPIAVGSFGCWRTGLTGSWSAVEEKNDKAGQDEI